MNGMKKIMAALCLLPLVLAAGLKIDIDGRADDLNIKAVKCSPKMSSQHPAWAKSPGYMIFTRGVSPKWGEFFCTFVSDQDGEVRIARRGPSSKRAENYWLIYKDFSITGAEVIFHSVCAAATKDLPPGEERCGHFHSVVDYVKVKANVPVTLKFKIRREGTFPADRFTKEEYQRKMPPKKLALRFTVDGLAGRIPVTADDPGRSFIREEKPLLFSGETGSVNLISRPVIKQEWRKFSFAFTPGLDGEIVLRRGAAGPLEHGIAEWVEFRNFKITGAEHSLAFRAKVNTSPEGLERMCRRAQLRDNVRVRKGRKVSVEFEARTAAAEPESQYARKDWMFLPQKYHIGWQDNLIQLLAGDDRGASFTWGGSGFHSLSGEKASFVRPETDKAPACDFSVPVEFLEEDGIARRTAVRFGFPLPAKSFYNVKNIAVTDAHGKAVPAGIYATGYWQDKSVKWVFIEFEADLKAREKAVFFVKGGKNVSPAPAKFPIVSPDGKKYRISTGKLTAVINRDSDALLENIVCGGKHFGDLKLAADVNAKSRIFAVTRENDTTFRLDGKLVSDRYAGGFTARLIFAGDSPVVKTIITFRADNLERELNELDSLHLFLTAGAGKLASGGVFQGNDLKYMVNGTKKPGFMPETDCFTSSSGTVTFALTDAGKRYPKAFAQNGNGLDIQLLPPQPSRDFNCDLPGYLRYPYMEGKYRIMAGMNFTEEVTFDFSGAPLSSRDVVPVIPASWHARAGAIRGVFADDTTKVFDGQAVKGFQEHLKLKAAQREYGFLNWGDWFGERGGCNWGNNEYDFAYGLLTLFARTGNRDIFRLGMQAARHQSDVDIIHATPYGNLIGGNYMHCVGHAGRRGEPRGKPAPWFSGVNNQGYAAATNGHSWCGGMFTAFLMSGKADIGDSALLLADEMIRFSGIPYRNKGNPRSHGWMLEGLMQAFDATGNQKYLDAGKAVADSFFACQALDKGGAWPFNLPRGYLRAGLKKGFGTSCFQMGIVIQALHHYSLRANRPEIRKNIAAAAGWLRKAYIPAAIGWPYVAFWDSKAAWTPSSSLNMLMLASSAADGDPSGHEIIRTGIGLYSLRGVGPMGIGKDLAMDLVFAPVAFEMLKAMPGKKEFGVQKFIDGIAGSPHLMRLRGPEHLKLELTLKESATTLFFVRDFYNARPGKVSKYKVEVKDPSGKTVFSFGGDANTPVDTAKSCVLNGKKGDRYTISITDNVSSYWDVCTSNRTPVRVHTSRESQFANGVSLFFGVRVPAGVRSFTVKYTSCHPGLYGLVTIGPDGKVISVDSKRNDTVQLPGGKAEKEVRGDNIRIERKDASKEEVYHFFTWSAGDILLDLDGVPRILEFVK